MQRRQLLRYGFLFLSFLCCFFAKQSLFAIASMVGRPLCMDNATMQLTRPSVARINVEVNLLHKLPSRIWIGTCTGKGGFWQSVEYEAVQFPFPF